MTPLRVISGVVAPLPWINIDTDMIMPKQYLKWLTRIGIGQGLFAGVRLLPGGEPDPDFCLNQPRYRNARFLVTGDNFGTGSSREHAVWALADAGISCVIATSFGDIFRQNALRNGILPLSLPAHAVDALLAFAAQAEEPVLELDLERQTLTPKGGSSVNFAIEPRDRDPLLEGRDEIADTLRLEAKIASFESGNVARPGDHPRTLYDKIWDSHVVADLSDGTSLVYVDRHLVHEVSSPLAFEGLRLAGRTPRRPALALAVTDHNVPTDRGRSVADPQSAAQIAALQKNATDFGIELFDLADRRQGVVHVVGPEQGAVLPGLVVACGDSHASTNGAFATLALGIGTSEIEHVLVTQTLRLTKAQNMLVELRGALPAGVSAKDLALAVIGELGANGASGYVVEFAGDAVSALSMEGRMTLCNMSIESGARAGLIAADATTFAYLADRPRAPKGAGLVEALELWREMHSDASAIFDRHLAIDVTNLPPLITWGTSPEDVIAVTGSVPDPASIEDEQRRLSKTRALDYMGLQPGQRICDIGIDRVFIGSCTNSRIEDLRIAAATIRGRRVNANVEAMVVPGSGLVKAQAEAEGIADIFREAGFEWRDAGCSMCVAMNTDTLRPGERCASTSNRNFVDRQGPGGRTHLVSPAMAAAAAIAGRFVDIRRSDW